MTEIEEKVNNEKGSDRIIKDIIELEDEELLKKEELKEKKEIDNQQRSLRENIENSRKLLDATKKLKNKADKFNKEAVQIYKQNRFDADIKDLDRVRNLGKIHRKQKKAIIILSILLGVFFITSFVRFASTPTINTINNYKNQLTLAEDKNKTLESINQDLEVSIDLFQNQVKNLDKENTKLKTASTTSTTEAEETVVKKTELDSYQSNISSIVKEYQLLINHIKTYENTTNIEEMIAFENTVLNKLAEIESKLKGVKVTSGYSDKQNYFLEKSSQMKQFIITRIEYLKSEDIANAETMLNNFYSAYSDFETSYKKLIK